jgi:SNF2 family DNA or RNA helicase
MQILRIIKNDLALENSQDEAHTRKPKINLKSVNFKPSSKLASLMENISFMFSQDNDSKCVCFSQWTAMLDIVETELIGHGLAFVRLDGTMSQSKRDQSLKKFKGDPKVRILVASLRATGIFKYCLKIRGWSEFN